MKRLLNRISHSSFGTNDEVNEKYYLLALKVHCVSLISFGTISTFICMSMLSTNSLSYFEISSNDWLLKAIIGSLSGASLVFLFFIFFSAIIFTNVIDNIKPAQQHVAKSMLIKLKLFNLAMYIIGLILFIGTAIVSLIYYNNTIGKAIIHKESITFLATLTFPVFMSGLLYFKSNSKIDSFIKINDDNYVNKKINFKNKTRYTIKLSVQILFLILFFILLLTGMMQAWLFILIAGFCTSIIMGQLYCNWCCPVNTMNSFFELLYKLLRIKKKKTSKLLQTSIFRIIFFSLFLVLFTFSLITRKRFQLFTIITFLGVLVSSIFTRSFWCNYLCPWGFLLKTISKYPKNILELKKKL